MRTVIVFLFMAAIASAQSVVVLSEDGKQAWYGPDGEETAKLVDRVVQLSGDSPTDPDDPDPPTDDKWGLVAVSETAARAVAGDPNRSETAGKLGTAYISIGKQLQSGAITPAQLKPTLELTFRFVAGAAADQWKPWQEATQAKYNSVQFTDEQLAGQGLIDIGIGAVRASDNALGDGTFLKFFLEVILPLILELIKLFPPAGGTA